jgi:hypothetical protein
MIGFINKIYLKHKNFWSKDSIFSLLRGGLLLLLALFVQGYANDYVDFVASTPVGDILLDNLPTVNVGFFVVQGVLILTLLIVFLFLIFPKLIPFAIKSLALFIVLRAFFVSLTHLGINPNQLALNPESIGFDIYNFFYSAKTDFFFSGHTGIPFLFALIFWNEKFWRYFFFVVSFVFGASMLLAHMHYSIDVFAAPFITYSIFVLSKHLFKDDFKLSIDMGDIK